MNRVPLQGLADKKAALEALASRPAADIDTSEIPEKKAFLKPRLGVAMTDYSVLWWKYEVSFYQRELLMSLNIKNEETHQLARELVQLTGETMTERLLSRCESALSAKDENAASNPNTAVTGDTQTLRPSAESWRSVRN